MGTENDAAQGFSAMTGGIDRETSVCIDSLRVVACGVVVASHVFEMVTGRQSNPINETLSYAAVVLFFFLSGYVNLFSYHRATSYGGFMRSRFQRLLPLYFLALGLSGCLAIVAGVSQSTDLFNLVFLQSLFVPVIETNAPLWSLAWEMVLYLVFPLLARFVQGQSVLALLFLVPIIFLFSIHPALFGAFVFGIVAAHYQVRFPRFRFAPGLGRRTYEIYIFHYPLLFLVLFIWKSKF